MPEKKTTKQTNESRLIIYGDYTKLIEGIKHFDEMQTGYRILTSEILLATFIALGYTISTAGEMFDSLRLWVVVGICILSILIISVFCCLDLVVKERLLIGNFAGALNSERKYRWIPPVHHNMVHEKGHRLKPRKIIFYLGSLFAPFLFIAISLPLAFKFYFDLYWLIIFFLVLVLYTVLCFILSKITGRFEFLLKEAIKSCRKKE